MSAVLGAVPFTFTCQVCEGTFPRKNRRGRPPRYCDAHRAEGRATQNRKTKRRRTRVRPACCVDSGKRTCPQHQVMRKFREDTARKARGRRDFDRPDPTADRAIAAVLGEEPPADVRPSDRLVLADLFGWYQGDERAESGKDTYVPREPAGNSGFQRWG